MLLSEISNNVNTLESNTDHGTVLQDMPELQREISRESHDHIPEEKAGAEAEVKKDNERFKGECLSPNKYFLTFKKSQRALAQNFEKELLEQEIKFQTRCMVVLLIAFILETVLIILVRREFSEILHLVIISLRCVYCLLLFFYLLSSKWLFDRNMRTVATFALYSFGILIVAGQSLLYEIFDTAFLVQIQTIHLMEFLFLYLIAVNCR